MPAQAQSVPTPAGSERLVVSVTPTTATSGSPQGTATAAAGQCNVFSRTHVCQTVRVTVQLLRNTTVVGQAMFTATHQMTLNTKSVHWSETVSYSKATLTGEAGGVLMNVTPVCGLPCKATSHIKPHTVGAAFSGTVSYSDGVRKNKTHNTATRYTYSFTKLGFTPAGGSYSSLSYRCDDTFWNAANTRRTLSAGCVFPRFTPTITTMQALPDISRNIRTIQGRGGHYGRFGSGHPLHRLVDATRSRANRDAVCPPNRRPPHPGLECDEYPFATTQEGGTALPAASRGTAWVPATEQRQQGGRVLTFVKAQRLLDRDAYWVQV